MFGGTLSEEVEQAAVAAANKQAAANGTSPSQHLNNNNSTLSLTNSNADDGEEYNTMGATVADDIAVSPQPNDSVNETSSTDMEEDDVRFEAITEPFLFDEDIIYPCYVTLPFVTDEQIQAACLPTHRMVSYFLYYIHE